MHDPPDDPFRIDRLCLRFLDALDARDHDALAELWHDAEADDVLEAALCELLDGLVADDRAKSNQTRPRRTDN